MPMYDYLCSNCEVIHEVLVTLDEAYNEVRCPDCNNILIKQISTPYFKVR